MSHSNIIIILWAKFSQICPIVILIVCTEINVDTNFYGIQNHRPDNAIPTEALYKASSLFQLP